QKHELEKIEATTRRETKRVPAGTILVRMAQPLASLAAYLLEPQAADGLATWNYFDAGLKQGEDFPVIRLLDSVSTPTGKVRPLPEDRKKDQPISVGQMPGGARRAGKIFKKGPPGRAGRMPSSTLPNFNGNPIGPISWLEDGEHFLQ